MRIAYFDCFSGISGDMAVGALLSAGLPLEHLRTELEKLSLEGYTLSSRLVERSMISAVKFDVELTSSVHTHEHVSQDIPHAQRAHDHEHGHGHGHDHAHTPEGDHGHEHSHPHEAVHRGGHVHLPLHEQSFEAEHEHLEHHVHTHGYSYEDIRSLISESDLSGQTKARSLSIFAAIAVAEARIHNVPLGDVHFHEVGSIDSIVDIVSVAIGLEYFAVEGCMSRTVPLGAGGTIRTAHGIMPIPTPATLEILKSYPTELGVIEAELTTPTGAGIVRALSKGVLGSKQRLVPEHVGYGAGTKDFPQAPNLLRVIIGELEGSNSQHSPTFPVTDEVVQLTTVIDDMPPTVLAYVQEQLFDTGALEAYFRPVLMKKGRPGQELVVLSTEARLESILALLASETTTLGVRVENVRRRIAHRAHGEISHPTFGVVRTKSIEHGAGTNRAGSLGVGRRVEFEYEDVKRIAREQGLSYREVSERLRLELLG